MLLGHTLVMEVNGYDIEPDANLWHADLEGANLNRANLRGATMPDGTKHD